MRVLFVALLLVGSAAAAPLLQDATVDGAPLDPRSSAQAADQQAAAGQLGQDAEGDVSSNVGAPLLPDLDEIDLVALGVREEPEAFLLDIGVAGLEPEMAPGILLAVQEIRFVHNEAAFTIVMGRSSFLGTGQYSAYMAQEQDGGYFSFSAALDVEADFDADTLTVHVPRELLRDASGTAPTAGRVLEAFAVSAYANQVSRNFDIMGQNLEAPYYEDHLPDEGVLEAVHEVVHGVASTGQLDLRAQEPFRASNGEATTFVFEVEAVNLGDEDAHVRFDASGYPPQWDVTLPPDMRLDGGQKRDVPVIVRTAFAHSHGNSESFVVTMTSQQDSGSVGRVQLGVYYPAIPQPAGHHDTLWFHSIDHSDDQFRFALGTVFGTAFSQTGMMEELYFNALEQDERADEVPAEPIKCGFTLLQPDHPVGTRYCWSMPLDPGLQMGLDFDLRRVGQLEATFASQLPLPGSMLQGQIVYLGQPDENDFGFSFRPRTTIATINGTEAVDISGSHTFLLDVVPLPEADLIPYARGAGLSVELQLTTLRPDTHVFGPPLPPPTLEPGGRLQLPLNEYADPVDEVAALGALHLRPLGEQERSVNPGKTVIFRAELHNAGNATEVALDVIGSHRDWVDLLTAGPIRLGKGANTTVSLAVTPPAGAAHGDMADLVLQASSLDDVGQRGLLRLVAHVDTSQDIPDERDQVDALRTKDKKSPGFEIAAVACGLLALALLRRRR